MSEDETRRQAIDAMAALAGVSLATRALREHRVTAEMSHTARVALAKLTSGAVERDAGKAEISLEDLEAVKEAFRIIQEAGHLAFLRAYGDEEDFQAIGKVVAPEVPAPGARKRK